MEGGGGLSGKVNKSLSSFVIRVLTIDHVLMTSREQVNQSASAFQVTVVLQGQQLEVIRSPQGSGGHWGAVVWPRGRQTVSGG